MPTVRPALRGCAYSPAAQRERPKDQIHRKGAEYQHAVETADNQNVPNSI